MPELLRGGATIPVAPDTRLDIDRIKKEESYVTIPSRHRIKRRRDQQLAANEMYIGHGHHSHRQQQAFTETLGSYFPEEIFDGFHSLT